MRSNPLIRCSGLDRLLSCSGSRTLEVKLATELIDFNFEYDGDPMTWRGNWCHWESARRFVRDHGAVAPDQIAPPVIPCDWRHEPWDERLVDWYVANVMAATPGDHAVFVEHRLTHSFARFDLTGQIDNYTISPDATEFTINDLKSGPNEVDEAGNNWQLAGYACLLKKTIPTLKRGTLRIFQRSASTPISEVEVDNLDTLVAFMEREINAALDAWLTLTTGYKQCRLCPCIECCDALHAEIIAMQLTLTEEKLAALKVTRDLKQLAELAARGRAIAGPIDRLLKTLKERIGASQQEVTLADGTRVGIVEERGTRTVTHPRAAFALVCEKIGDDQAWETLSMSLAALEDLLVESGMKRTSKNGESATSWVKDHMAHLIAQPKVKKLKFA